MQSELGDHVQALLVRYRLYMVEHHGDRLVHRGDSGHEPGDDDDVGARGRQRPEYRRVDRFDPVQRDRESAQQRNRVVIFFAAGDPGQARPDPLGPLRQERCLAVPRRGDHRDDRRSGCGQPAN